MAQSLAAPMAAGQLAAAHRVAVLSLSDHREVDHRAAARSLAGPMAAVQLAAAQQEAAKLAYHRA